MGSSLDVSLNNETLSVSAITEGPRTHVFVVYDTFQINLRPHMWLYHSPIDNSNIVAVDKYCLLPAAAPAYLIIITIIATGYCCNNYC